MPRSAGEAIPQYRKHRGSSQAVVTISGRDHYLGPHGTKTSKFEYDRLVGEWLASGRSLGYGVAQNDLTISKLLASCENCGDKKVSGGGTLLTAKLVLSSK